MSSQENRFPIATKLEGYRGVPPCSPSPEVGYSQRSPLVILVPRVARLFSIGKLATSAVLGQGLFAGANFVINVLLARWFLPPQYGAFALAYSAFLLFSVLYCACIYEPLIVFGSVKYASRFDTYLTLLMRVNVVLVGGIALSILALSLLLGRFYSTSVQSACIAIAFAAPFILTTWLSRAAFYARQQPVAAAYGGAIYFGALVGGALCLRSRGDLSATTACLAMGLAGLTTNVFLLRKANLSWRLKKRDISLSSILKDHWRYGGWALAAAAIAWFPDNIYYAVLPRKAGLEAAAHLRALINLINPILHTQIALSSVLIPSLVRRRQPGCGRSGMSKPTIVLLAAMASCSVCYVTLLLSCRTFLFRVLYHGQYEVGSRTPLILLGAFLMATGGISVLGSALRALERPDLIFWCYVAAVVTAVCVGLPLAAKWGVTGAVGGISLSGFVAASAMAFCFFRTTPQSAIGNVN